VTHRARLLLALITIAGCSPDGTPPLGRFAVRGGFLRDREGRATVLRGVNLSSDHKSKPYFGFHGPSDFARVRQQWGMNAVRFLLSWAAIEPQRGAIDEHYLDEVLKRMQWAQDADLLVVLDMHQDLFGEGFGGDGAPRWACDEEKYAAHKPTTPWFANYASPPVMACFDRLYTDDPTVTRFAEAWRRVAERLVGQPSVIGFDVLNEPHWGSNSLWTFEAERLQPFYGRVIDAVRGAAPEWIAFLEPAASRNLGIASALQPFSQPDVVYAPHSYDADAESGQGFDPAHRAPLLANLAALAAEARALNAALWIGEYGGVAAQSGIGDYMTAQYDGAGAAAAGAMYWHYGKDAGYGLLDADGVEKTTLLDVLVRPYPERVAGDPVSYGFDPATRTFRLEYLPDDRVTAPTEISVPDRVYPAGYSVSCDGCVSEKRAGALRVTRPGATAGRATTITLSPL
jgi:endoglycosylceramidase